MGVVVDSSVLVAALVDTDPHGTWAEEVLSSGSLHAPELARVEATNILRRLPLATLDRRLPLAKGVSCRFLTSK